MTGKKPKVVVLVQARMGSTRLPGKHLKSVLGRPLVSLLFERLKRAGSADAIVLATTTNPKDDVLAGFCQENGISCFRGSEDDVLGRFAEAAKAYHADIIVRICADCPLIDPAVIDLVVKAYSEGGGFDMATNVADRTYPRGMDVEVFSAEALMVAAAEAYHPDEREHVTPFFYKHPERFRIKSVSYATDQSKYRWTVDTDEDLRYVARYFEELYQTNPQFTLEDLLSCAREHPDWDEINAHVRQKVLEEAANTHYGLECVRPIEEHGRIVFSWRNDAETLKASFHKMPKVWESFFPDFLRNYFVFPDLPPLFILESGTRVAFIRLEPVEHPTNPGRKCAKISINVAPEARGRGVGVQALLLAREFLRSHLYDDAYAEVIVGNEASARAFERAGFSRLPDKQITVFDTGEDVAIHRFLAALSTKSSYALRHVYIIAEAGSNWRNGKGPLDFTLAKELIEAAAEAGADAVKFQVFRPETIYVPNAGQANYLVRAGMDEDISEIFKNVTMPPEMIPQLAKWAQEAGIDFMASSFSIDDFAAIDPYVSVHKIPSYEIGHIRLLEAAAKTGKPLIMSTGAANESEIAWSVNTLRALGVSKLTLMQCTACYPAAARAMNLLAIPWLQQRFHADAGLSDHSPDPLAAPLGAVALGATVIEKHFTLDKGFEGPDHAFAITPPELQAMVREIRLLEEMRGSGMKYVHDDELELRSFVRRGVQAIKDIRKGDPLIEGQNISILRPGKQPLGLHPLFLPKIEGKAARRNISIGNGIQHGDF